MENGELLDPGSHDNGSFKATGRFQQPAENNLNVSVTADTLNIHSSNLSALESLARHSPEIASQLINSVQHAEEHDTSRYTTAAVLAGVVCCVMMLCVTAIIMTRGTFDGIVFFLVSAAVAAIFSAIFTGKSQSLDWTVAMFRKENDEGDDTK